MRDHEPEFRVRYMCRVLHVHPSGYYAWRRAPLSARTKDDRRALALIKVMLTFQRTPFNTGFRITTARNAWPTHYFDQKSWMRSVEAGWVAFRWRSLCRCGV